MINDDDITCNYLQDVAELYRYTLNGLEENMPLKKEIEFLNFY